MNLFGWETASTLSLDAMNPRFGAATTSGDTFFSANLGPITLRGQFGPWAIEPGGSGQYINIAIPLTIGSLGGPQPVDFTNVVVHLQVVLRFNAVAGGGQSLALHLGQYVDEGGADPSTGPVYFRDLDDPAKQLNAFQRTLLGKTLGQMVVNFRNDYEHVFATAGLLGKGTPDWLVPTALQYVYSESDSGKGWVTIVAVTYGQDVSDLQAAVDEDLISGDGNAGIAISGRLFLRNVLAPLLPAAFDFDGDTTDFGWDGIANQLVSMRSIRTKKVHTSLTTYEPTADKIKLTLAGETLLTEIDGTCDMGWGVGLSYTVSMQHRATFQPQTGTLVLTQAGDPSSSDSVSGAGADVPGIAELIALIVRAIADAIGSSVAGSLTQSLANLTITRVPPLSVDWTGVSNFSITAAGLDAGLWMSGTVA